MGASRPPRTLVGGLPRLNFWGLRHLDPPKKDPDDKRNPYRAQNLARAVKFDRWRLV